MSIWSFASEIDIVTASEQGYPNLLGLQLYQITTIKSSIKTPRMSWYPLKYLYPSGVLL
jgi:hypothetical protein